MISGYSQQLDEDLKTIAEHGGDCGRYKAKYIDLLSSWLGSKSRCYSVMITGPANFNNSRHEKANRSEHKAYETFTEWRDKALHAITKPESTDIVKGEGGAIDKMKVKLATLEATQEKMKAVNKIVRDKKENKVFRIVEADLLTEEQAIKILSPEGNWWGNGFAPFSLTNNGAKIRNLKKDIEAEEKRALHYADGNKEHDIKGIKVVENVEDNRLQLFFDGKPESNVITELKRNAFKWSPRNGCWQRQLTGNATYAFKRMIQSEAFTKTH